MKSTMKVFGIFLVLVLSLVTVNAVSPDYDISAVKVNGRDVAEADTNFITVERGETLDLEIWVQGNGVVRNDVRVKAWVGGYEFGDVSEKTSLFKVEPNGLYKKRLIVDIPDDIDADNNGNSEKYALHVEAFDKDNAESKNFNLKFDEKSHDLRVRDVIFRPGNVVNANDMLFTTVRVENMGDNKEEDVQVKLTIPELGFVARDYINELVPHEDDSNDAESSSDVDLFGRIPRNAKAGQYEVVVDLIYNRGHEVVSETFLL